MKKATFALVFTVAIGIAVLAQQNPPAGQGRGGGGQGKAAPAVPNLSLRPTGSSLGTIRAGAADNKIWFNWHVAVPTADFHQLTFSEAITKADTLGVTGVEASSTQRISPEIPKALDYHLQQGERAAVVRAMKEYNQAIFAYRVDNIGADERSQREVFEFAKSINVPMIVTNAQPAALASLDKLAAAIDRNSSARSL